MMRGQFAIVTMMAFVIGIIFYAVGVYPIMNSVITAALPGMDSTTASILSLCPAVVLLFMIMSGLFYVMPQRQEQGGQ